jgi:hypothetical protein
MANPFISLAEPILANEPTLTNEQRADLFDMFHQSATADELAQKIAPLDLPTDLKARLYTAHKQQSAPTTPLDKTIAALNRLKEIDAETLSKAEAYPQVMKQITHGL